MTIGVLRSEVVNFIEKFNSINLGDYEMELI